MIYGSVCSGIEAATVAWHPMGWRPSFFSEIEAFPRAVLAHHYPATPLHGDFTTIEDGQYEPIDLLVGGTPCQDFSVAGLRAGMAGDRGNLTLQFLTLARRLRPRWVVWENVPGVLSSGGGRDFGSFLGGLGELGYGWAYRTLDAQYFGVPQRRRRVFVVGYLGDWRRAAAVLFERHSLQGHPAPRREAWATTAGALAGVSPGGGWRVGADEAAANQLVAGTLCNNGKAAGSATQQDAETGYLVSHAYQCHGGNVGPMGTLRTGSNEAGGVPFIAHALRAEGFDASEDGTGRGTPLVPVMPFDTTQITSPENRSNPRYGDPCHGLSAKAHAPAVAFNWQRGGDHTTSLALEVEKTPTIQRSQSLAVQLASAVRRLTPRECERLQGFPDDYTLIPYGKKLAGEAKEELARYFERTGQYMREVGPQKWVFDRERFEKAWPKIAADGPRYKALGNSMAVPVMRWIGERIAMVEALA